FGAVERISLAGRAARIDAILQVALLAERQKSRNSADYQARSANAERDVRERVVLFGGLVDRRRWRLDWDYGRRARSRRRRRGGGVRILLEVDRDFLRAAC